MYIDPNPIAHEFKMQSVLLKVSTVPFESNLTNTCSLILHSWNFVVHVRPTGFHSERLKAEAIANIVHLARGLINCLCSTLTLQNCSGWSCFFELYLYQARTKKGFVWDHMRRIPGKPRIDNRGIEPSGTHFQSLTALLSSFWWYSNAEWWIATVLFNCTISLRDSSGCTFR
jgi:hypothetical protein